MKTVALVGLGRIAWRGFDVPGVETHMDGIRACAGLKLIAGIDTDPVARLDFQSATGCLVYEDMQHVDADIAVICTPPEQHVAAVCHAVESGARAIVCEKPLAPTIAGCRQILDAVKGLPLLVAHQRRYDRNHSLAARFIKSEALGGVLAASAVFSVGGGWLNNGSHAADTAHMLAGQNCPISLHSSQDKHILSVKVLCDGGSITLDSYGKLHSGYMQSMYSDLRDCIYYGKAPECGGEDGMEAVRLVLAAEEAERAA